MPFLLILLEESKTKCSRHSEAAVVRRAAAEPDNDLIRATARGSNQHFADAKCVRAKWIAFAGRESAHPRRLTHFHDCEFAMLNPGIARVDFAPERIVRRTIYPITIERVANNFGRPFAAIGHGHHVDLCARQNIA